jgi:hypothetical protein
VADPTERLRLVKRIADWAATAVDAAEEYKSAHDNAEARQKEAKDRVAAAEDVLRDAEARVKTLVDQESAARAVRCALDPTAPAWVDAVTACTALGTRRMAAEAPMRTLSFIGSKHTLGPALRDALQARWPDLAGTPLVDAFFGSGAFTQAVHDLFGDLYLNDLEYFSYVIAHGLFVEPLDFSSVRPAAEDGYVTKTYCIERGCEVVHRDKKSRQSSDFLPS